MTDTLIAHPFVAVLLAQVVGAAFVLLAILVLFPAHRRALVDPLVAWWTRTFTTAGDGCIDCNRTSLTFCCPSCLRTRIMRPVETIPTPEYVANLTAYRRAIEQQRALDQMEPVSEAVN